MNKQTKVAVTTLKTAESNARRNQLRTSARATLKKVKDASPCAVIRALAHALPNTPRRDFMEVFTSKGAGFKVSPHTVSRQFHLGRTTSAR
jgi:hypothetical protein